MGIERSIPSCVIAAIAAVVMYGVRAGEEMYYFKDEHGVPHFTNVPADPRYQLIFSTAHPVASHSQPTGPLAGDAYEPTELLVEDTHPEQPEDGSGPGENPEPDELEVTGSQGRK